MKRIVLSLAALTALICCNPSASRAGGYGNGPWCAVTNTGAGRMDWNCGFYSIEQCTPNVVAGNRGFCQMNPRYRPGPVPAPHRRHYWRHHPPYH